jgi:glycine cleavage system regulatory protein
MFTTTTTCTSTTDPVAESERARMTKISAEVNDHLHAMNTYAVLLKLRDKPGAMESIAATFAHRGISLATILANDAPSAPDSLATVLVTFRTTLAWKETMKGNPLPALAVRLTDRAH